MFIDTPKNVTTDAPEDKDVALIAVVATAGVTKSVIIGSPKDISYL